MASCYRSRPPPPPIARAHIRSISNKDEIYPVWYSPLNLALYKAEHGMQFSKKEKSTVQKIVWVLFEVH